MARKVISGDLNLVAAEMSLKIEDTLNQPTLRSVFKGNDTVCFTFVNFLTKRFVDSFGFSTKLSTSQIEMITVDAIENFRYESVQDVIIFLKMARSGKFGTTNRGIDANLIFGTWFPIYLELKADLREKKYSEIKNKQNKEDISYQSVQKYYEKQKNERNRIEERQKEKQKSISNIDEITKDFDRQMLEDLILDWSKDESKSKELKLLKQKRRTIKWIKNS